MTRFAVVKFIVAIGGDERPVLVDRTRLPKWPLAFHVVEVHAPPFIYAKLIPANVIRI